MPRDDDRKRRRRATDALLFDVPVPELGLPNHDQLAEATTELDAMLAGVRPEPEGFERALDSVSVPAVGGLDVETSVLPAGVGVDPAEADLRLDEDGKVVEAGELSADAAGDVVEIAVDGGSEAATVVVDAGGEAIEVVADAGGGAADVGGDAAAEAVIEVVAAALEGV